MNEVFPKLVGLGIDAFPQRSNVTVNENIIKPKFPIESLVEGFSQEEYKSAFFLLMDYGVDTKNFTSLTNQDLSHLKAKFIKICQNFKDESIFIELFGTLKMYKKLKLFDTCFHVYESQSYIFNKIGGIWKVLYMLCEEMTDDDVKILKQRVPECYRNSIQSAEDWFCWAFNEQKFSRTNLSYLETIFKEYPNCLKIIRSLKDFELVYPLKVPSSSSPCGIALILNYETFNKNSKLADRHNSDKDVDSLKQLWKMFGFKTEVHKDLSSSKTFEIIKDCSLVNHTSFDAFVCCILSHGRSNAVYSSDGLLMEISDLIKPIMNDCLTLNNKPKLFFIQACQGTYIHQGAGKVVYQIPGDSNSVQSPPPILVDTLISNSSIDGYVSFRDGKGSWFIQTLCKIMMEYGDTYSIEEVLTKLNDEISNKFSADFGPNGPNKALQMPGYNSSLRKKLILKKCSE